MNKKKTAKIRRFFVFCRKGEKFVKKAKTWKKGRKTLAKKRGKGYYIAIK